eukprot:9697280-Alexandrium_andersonii.AAC.1
MQWPERKLEGGQPNKVLPMERGARANTNSGGELHPPPLLRNACWRARARLCGEWVRAERAASPAMHRT